MSDQCEDQIRTAAALAKMTPGQTDAAVRALVQVQKDFPVESRNDRRSGRRQKRLTRKAAFQSGMVANDAPWLVKLLGEAAAFLPAPWGPIAQAVIWAIEKFLEVE